MKSFYQYLNEIHNDELESIDLSRDLHFDNIFGKKLRIAFPLDQNSYLNELIEELQNLDYKVDYQDIINKKIVYKKIKTNQGEKLRAEKVGKALQSNKLPKLLDWWQKNSDKLKNMDSGASVIISRSPIDLVRMSDHDGITSCHSPQSSYFKCAKQEAKTGGAVAYVVKNSDLKKVNLQDHEIFEDHDRNVDGIVPLERLRLRRLSNENINLLLPELNTYGVRNIGFLDAVNKWAKSSQSEVLKKIDSIKDFKSFEIRGGSYTDNYPNRLWSKFFDVEISGSMRNPDEEEEEEEANSIERAERQLEEHQQNWNHISVHLDEAGEDYLYYNANGFFKIPKKQFIVDFDDKYDKIKEIIADSIDIYYIDHLEIDEDYKDKNNYTVSFSFNNEEDQRYNNQNEAFEHFLDYVDDIDSNFENHINKVFLELIKKEIIKNPTGKLKFDNFDIEIDKYDSVEISMKNPEKVFYIKDFEIFRGNIVSKGNKVYLTNSGLLDFGQSGLFQDVVEIINKNKIFPFQIENISFFLFEKETSGWLPTRRNLYDDKWKERDQYDKLDLNNYTKISGWLYFYISHDLIRNDKTHKIISKIKFLDKNFDFYIEKINKIIETWLKNYRKFNFKLNKSNNVPRFKKQPKQLSLGFKEWLETTVN